MKKFRNQATPLPKSCIYEIDSSKKDSKTIPDQSTSIREVLHRYTTGQSLDIANAIQPIYLEDQPLYDTRRKTNIDIASDRLDHERRVNELDVRIYDNVTELAKITKAKRKPENQPVNNPNPSPTPPTE